jgi:glycosyltransferase involved in cell wall biosynthesis
MSDKPLVSVLMPTVNPIEGLAKALSSIKSTATRFDQVEILLRVDDDNKQRISELPQLEAEFGVKAFIGPRGAGYNDMRVFINDLAKLATGTWSWLFDDDAYIEGSWQGQLESIPCMGANGPAINSEFYVLGLSRYSNWPKCGPPGLIIPTAVAKALDHQSPVDDQWMSVALQNNWPIKLLKGVSYYQNGRIR